VIALLRTRRWITFTIVVVVVIVSFGFLSRWQWSRAQDKRVDRITLAQSVGATPESVDAALDQGMTSKLQWHRVTAQGQWLPETQILVRRRPLNSTNGFWVMTAFRTATGADLWINRGWIPAQSSATSQVQAPAPDPGVVDITGYLREFENEPVQQGLPQGQVSSVSAQALPALATSLPAYVQLATPTQTGLIALPTPEVNEGQNISYAVQWLLFAFVSVGGWFFFLRREAREDSNQPEDVRRL